RRDHVAKVSGERFQPFLARDGMTASVRPFCISTMVPYWSKASALISRLRISGRSIAVSSGLGAGIGRKSPQGLPGCGIGGKEGLQRQLRQGDVERRAEHGGGAEEREEALGGGEWQGHEQAGILALVRRPGPYRNPRRRGPELAPA